MEVRFAHPGKSLVCTRHIRELLQVSEEHMYFGLAQMLERGHILAALVQPIE